ncbi:hypothetical protein Tco_0773483 [Tanacetum coccineum]|uniref:Uncharacterized protein n=1 Tax=Tanacetum coccineum TaxID=301880 RepID=A0ABQ4ZNV5_9ASTR
MVINSPCVNSKKELAIPEQTATGKESSNPLMADSLPKTIIPTKLVKPQDFNLRHKGCNTEADVVIRTEPTDLNPLTEGVLINMSAWFIHCVFRGILKYSLTDLDMNLKRITEPDTTWTNMGFIEYVYHEVSGIYFAKVFIPFPKKKCQEGPEINMGIQWFEEAVKDVQEV